MPQTPLNAQNAVISSGGGQASKLNVTTTTVVKATPGRLIAVNVSTAGSAAGAVYDANTTAGNVAANLIASIAQTATTQPLVLNWPCANGILVVPPTGGTVSISYL